MFPAYRMYGRMDHHFQTLSTVIDARWGPQNLPDNYKNSKLREYVPYLGQDVQVVTEEGLWASDIIVKYAFKN